MSFPRLSRRAFIQGSVSALALSSFPGRSVFAQTAVRVRPEWTEFRSSPDYASFIDAIRAMRANTNAGSRSSLQYWANAHVNYCPHSMPYFLAWHRGYLYYFEQQLRIVSGNGNLVLPYWDYFRNPNIPAEFTDAARGNPLYLPRANTNVYAALTLRPFDPTIWNFQRGTGNAFEAILEDAPHNPIHNIIGGTMQTMQAPLDVLFFLHHANVDRLWHAWALPDGKGIPWTSSPYWSGSLRYAADLTLARSQCYHPNWVGTDYADGAAPAALPPQAFRKGRIIRVQAQQGRQRGRPPVGDFAGSGPRTIAAGRKSIGGARDVGLTEDSISVSVPLQGADRESLQALALRRRGRQAGAAPAGSYKSVNIVLDDVKVLSSGKAGGFYYKVYLNLPERGETNGTEDAYLLGTFGPFEIESASHQAHHGGTAQLVFPATEMLANMTDEDFKNLTVSLVRVSGKNAPKGRAISAGEVRVEVSTDEPYDLTPPVPAPPDGPYRRR